MEQVAKGSKVKFFMLDAAYDQLINYEAVRNVKAQAIIPMNLRNEKESSAGMTSSGTPCCSMGFAMTYWGADGDHLRFRCPHATGKVDCPCMLIFKLWNGHQCRYEKRSTVLLQSTSGHETLEGAL